MKAIKTLVKEIKANTLTQSEQKQAEKLAERKSEIAEHSNTIFKNLNENLVKDMESIKNTDTFLRTVGEEVSSLFDTLDNTTFTNVVRRINNALTVRMSDDRYKLINTNTTSKDFTIVANYKNKLVSVNFDNFGKNTKNLTLWAERGAYKKAEKMFNSFTKFCEKNSLDALSIIPMDYQEKLFEGMIVTADEAKKASCQ